MQINTFQKDTKQFNMIYTILTLLIITLLYVVYNLLQKMEKYEDAYEEIDELDEAANKRKFSNIEQLFEKIAEHAHDYQNNLEEQGEFNKNELS